MWEFYLQIIATKAIKILGQKKIYAVENELTLEFTIRKIRNAISHSSVDIFDDMSFLFSDEDGTQIHFTNSGLQKFTEKLADCFMNQKWD